MTAAWPSPAPLIRRPLAGWKTGGEVVPSSRIPYRIAFWVSLTVLLLLLACVPFLPAGGEGRSLDYARTRFSLAVAHTFLDSLRAVAVVYCVFTSLAVVHLYQKARGRPGTYSFLAYAVPNTVVLLMVCAAIACVFAAEHAVQAVAESGDFAKTALYYASGEEAIYGGGAPPLQLVVLALAVNVPFWFVLTMRSWKPIAQEATSQPADRTAAAR